MVVEAGERVGTLADSDSVRDSVNARTDWGGSIGDAAIARDGLTDKVRLARIPRLDTRPNLRPSDARDARRRATGDALVVNTRGAARAQAVHTDADRRAVAHEGSAANCGSARAAGRAHVVHTRADRRGEALVVNAYADRARAGRT